MIKTSKSLDDMNKENGLHLTNNYDNSKFNSLKHGILSKYSVMPWEDRAEYEDLLCGIINEYKPQGVTEEHLVEELAGIIWRKTRLKKSENAEINKSIGSEISGYSSNENIAKALLIENKHINLKQALLVPESENAVQLEKDVIKLKNIQSLLKDLEKGTYQTVIKSMDKEILKEWKEDIGEFFDDDEIIEETSESLFSWLDSYKESLESDVMELKNRTRVKEYIYAKSYLHENNNDKFIRYENHLDRKMERTIATLIKFKEMRILKA